MHTKEEKLAAFSRLLDTMDALREKCPWNAAQTMETIRPMTEEEVYELSDTILKGDRAGTAKEIGDLLYHLVFYARIGQEEGSFDIADSLDKVVDKMVFRHPHVFGPEAGRPTTAKEIADTWELVKAKEKDGNKTVLSGIPDAMPAILKALSMQEKARGCGFDWERREEVWEKVRIRRPAVRGHQCRPPVRGGPRGRAQRMLLEVPPPLQLSGRTDPQEGPETRRHDPRRNGRRLGRRKSERPVAAGAPLRADENYFPGRFAGKPISAPPSTRRRTAPAPTEIKVFRNDGRNR